MFTLGKPFKKEIQGLYPTYKWALTAETAKLTRFVKESQSLPLLSVGSGGSLISAIFSCLLHQETGMISQPLTPLELAFSTYDLRLTSMILFTARGTNTDILTSVKVAIDREPRKLMVLCAAKDSPVGRIASKYDFISTHEFEPPGGKDGFLATNSLLASCVLLFRAYNNSLDLRYGLPESLESLVHPKISRHSFLCALEKELHPLLGKDTFVVLHGKWGKPPSSDLESKFTEAALGNVQLADYRNFAHGRHNWLAKNGDRTGVIAFITPQDKEIAERILDLIPEDIPIAKMEVQESGPVATLSLLVKTIYLVDVFGQSRGIDPGKPHVPKFGRKMYRLRIPLKTALVKVNAPFERVSPSEAVAISRKIKHPGKSTLDRGIVDFWIDAYDRFVRDLTQAEYVAAVFDYDGTLCDSEHRFSGAPKKIGRELSRLLENDIIVGIATGRGKSVRNDLQRIIPRLHWRDVVVAYYNGSDIGLLNDNTHPDKDLKVDPRLRAFLSFLKKYSILDRIATYECRPKQITFSPTDLLPLREVVNLLFDLARRAGKMEIQILESTHSIDVLAPGVSKLELVETVQMMTSESTNSATVLCIGDKGEWPGNDFALLSKRYSLSVDTVSSDPYSCWNIAPHGYRGVQATLHYINALELEPGIMKFNHEKLGVK